MKSAFWIIPAWLAIIASTLPVIADIPPHQIYSNPRLPTADELQRLNLHLSWQSGIPMDGRKDGFLQIHFEDKDLFALTRSGLITCLDAETGIVRWRQRVGKPYTLLPYFSVNSRSIYVISNATMFSLDRETGKERWERPLPAGISAPPAVDEEMIFVPAATNRLYAFYLPFVQGTQDTFSLGEVKRESLIYSRRGDDEKPTLRPVWVDDTNIRLKFRPLQTNNEILAVSPDGIGLGLTKIPKDGYAYNEIYKFDFASKINVQPTGFGDYGYIGADDANLYAINLINGKLNWRHTAGTKISRPPIATEKDIYLSSESEGLTRLDRATGEVKWKVGRPNGWFDSNPVADRFLAANNRYVYATDHSGRLMVLDRNRGSGLSFLHSRDFYFPVVNDVTDRLYLSANDGLLVCLHDRDQAQPVRHRKIL
ncbi:MAG: PQQ-binding-like beta-propeller repeat protein, partial [Gemmataceae bacterium]